MSSERDRPRARPTNRRPIRAEPTIGSYVVVEDSDLHDLQEAVLILIDAGWVPTGGLCTVPPGGVGGPHHWWFYQAMMLPIS